MVGATRPDLTLVFDLDPEQGLLARTDRGDAAEDRYERKGLDFHRRLRERFPRHPAIASQSAAGLSTRRRSVDDVSNQVWSIVSERL